MKKIFTLLCAALMTLSTVNASVIFVEHFDRNNTWDAEKEQYALATSRFSSGATVPNDSNWHTYSVATIRFLVTDQQLSYTNYCAASTGKSVHYESNHSRDYIRFKDEIAATAGTKVYLAFLLKATTLNSSTNSNRIVTLLTDPASSAFGGMQNCVYLKTIESGKFALGIGRRTEAATYASEEFSTGQTYLVVAEYNFIDGTTNDEVKLYVNPSKDSPVSIAQTTGTGEDAPKFVGAVLNSSGTTPTNMLIDEIKIATSWDDLWENGGSGGGGDPTPAIVVDNPVSLGDAYGNTFSHKSYSRDITVLADGLTSDISVSHKNSAVSLSATSISKNGGSLTISLNNPAGEGYGYDTIAFASGTVKDTAFVSWYNYLSYGTIAELKAAYAGKTEWTDSYNYHGQAIVTRKYGSSFNLNFYMQDATGAILIENAWGQLTDDDAVQVGDKITELWTVLGEVNGSGIQTHIPLADPQIVSPDNSVDPQTVTLAELQAHPADYLLEIVKIENVALDQHSGQFQPGTNVGISQSGKNGNIQPINSSADYIGVDIPAEATIVGFSVNTAGTIIVPRSKADIITGATGIGEVRSETANAARSEKIIRDGQLIIVKDGKMFNVIGVEL